jgi:hypothetical protein
MAVEIRFVKRAKGEARRGGMKNKN